MACYSFEIFEYCKTISSFELLKRWKDMHKSPGIQICVCLVSASVSAYNTLILVESFLL